MLGLLSPNEILTGYRYSKLPFGDPKQLEITYKHVLGILNDALENCPKSGNEDLPISEAALRAACIFDYLNRAVDDKGQKLPKELAAPNMLPGKICYTKTPFAAVTDSGTR